MLLVNRFFFTLIIGFIIAWIFDVLEMLINETKFKHKKYIRVIKDFYCSITYFILIILLLYYFNKGAFRGIYIFAMSLGSYLYFAAFSKILRKLSNFLLKPFIFVIEYFIIFVRKIISFLLHTIEKMVIKLYNGIKKCKS